MYRQKTMTRLKNCKQNGKKSPAQVSLELALSLICVFLLLLGCLKVFVWVNSRLVMRQEDYERSRVSAGSGTSGQETQVDESRYPKLDIFGNTQAYIPK